MQEKHYAFLDLSTMLLTITINKKYKQAGF